MKRRAAVIVTSLAMSMALVGLLAAASQAHAAALPGGSLDPMTVPKYVESLTIPPLMPRVAPGIYSISVRPHVQQVLPGGFPATKVFAYGSTFDARSFNWPAFTIEARQGTPSTVVWRNELVDAKLGFVPHLLPIDQTLHWANPPGMCAGGMGTTQTDCRGFDPNPYTGPVPIVTHLHGAHVDPESDGYPEAWYLPFAVDIKPCSTVNPAPGCFFTRGSNYGNAPGFRAFPGQAIFRYRNDQRATTLWFHDHTLGMTRANVYAGLAGFYLLRDSYERALNLPGPYGKYEIPLAIQDRSFNADGSLFYPDSRTFFDGFAGPYIPDARSDISPLWNPEFFGNHMVVNGKTWPKLAVEPRKYRFRVLNGSDSRWLVLTFAAGNPPNPVPQPLVKPLLFNVIGTDGGLVTGAPVAVDQLRLGPGERFDVVVDFSGFKVGTRLILTNIGPDSPFGGAVDTTPGVVADPDTTGQVMAFDVVKLTAPDRSVLPAALNPPPDGFEPKTVTNSRTLTITEFDSSKVCVDAANVYVPGVTPPDCNALSVPLGPSEAQLGDAFGPLPWMAPITENLRRFATEEWTIVNRTADAHPIHLHQTQFRVVSRAQIDQAAYDAALAGCGANPPVGSCPPNPDSFVLGPYEPPFPWEAGPKDTLQTNPGTITKLRAYFDIPGLYVWHCHILSHEDNEMMRPLCVSPDPNKPICKP